MGHILARSTRAPPACAASCSTRRPHRGDGAARADAALTRSRAGWSTPDGDLGHAAGHRAGGPAKAGLTAADIRAIAITNQRETTLLWEPAHRPTGAPRHRLAGPAHRALLRRCRRAGAGADGAARHRAAHRPVLLATKLRWLLDQVRARTWRRPRPASWPSAPSTAGWWQADRRRGACHRRDQRVAHHAAGHPPQRLGPTNLRRRQTCQSMLPRMLPSSRACSAPPTRLFGRPSHRRCRRRPAGGAPSGRLLPRGHGEEHYGTGASC